MPAADEEIAEAEEEGVKLRFPVSPAEISGDGHAQELKLEIMELGGADEKGRRRPAGTGKFETLKVSAVISSIGQKIDLCGINEGSGMELGSRGNVIAHTGTLQTGQSDVFAGGDVLTGPRFAIEAIAAGKEAAVSIHRFVREGRSLTLGRDRRDYRALDINNAAVSIESFDTAPRQTAAGGSAAEAGKTFEDLRGILTGEQIKKEADGCLGCGGVVVVDCMCIGCGICTTRCKFDAIHLEKVSDYKYENYFNTLGRVVRDVPRTISSLRSEKLKGGNR